MEIVEKCGVFIPGIARSCNKGDYEIIAGHMRKQACEFGEVNLLYHKNKTANSDNLD